MTLKQPCVKYQYVVTPSGPKILPVEEPSCKDEESPADYNVGGYLPVKIGDGFKHGRYCVVRKLGWGHFSTVWLVKDTQNQCHSALKVVKSAGRYAETARDEIKLLTHVSSFSPSHTGRQHIVSFFDSFSHQGPESSHVCIVFEPLGENLLALIERNKKKGVPKALVKVITKQVLLGLQYLHDECDLVHTDIKPENILISISDIEAHIQNELAQSSSPTSRRVGVPLPTKSRSGVSIPYNPSRARRQVQIFNSQPLSSPGRTWVRSADQVTSVAGRPNESGSGANSVPGSYFAQMHISRLTGSTSVSHFHSPTGFTSGLSSSVPKVSSGLSSYSTCAEDVRKAEKKAFVVHDPPPTVPAPPPTRSNAISPSTSSSSSSSSSISSTMASTTIGSSSLTSTPPTSLSNSIGNVVAGFIGLAKVATEVNSRLVGTNHYEQDTGSTAERAGVPVRSAKGKERETLEGDSQNAMSSSWKVNFGLSSSWKEKVSSLASLRSTASADSKPHLTTGLHHLRSSSGLSSSSFWKDPGTAPPAPAVVVSAVARADGREDTGEFFPLPNAMLSSVQCAESAASGSSSVTATPARPSPTGTPLPVDTKKAKSDHPSLLTQTAPPRPLSGGKRALPRPSPSKQISQLSAQMYTRHPPSSGKCEFSGHQSKRTTKSRTIARLIQSQHSPNSKNTSSSDTTEPTLSVPPPTPVASPTSSHISSLYINVPEHTSSGELPPEYIVPPIAVKIADLGNATPSTKHYTEDIQTRQYRAPEAILGRRDWDARADIWSVACVAFELLTAEYLFDPQSQGELFSKDDDHMAQIIELMGDFPLSVKMGGRYSRELFDHTGALRYIRTLKPWPLKRVMTEKYSYSESDSIDLCSFLEPMLAVDMWDRKRARDMIDHPWLIPTEADGIVTGW
ncbi:Protein kinase dsk1 [Leucoagaricus sp. SymC.cos]|nr:Protein kinase dsk1 [Leucoagaricus sp. SymC.cos]